LQYIFVVEQEALPCARCLSIVCDRFVIGFLGPCGAARSLDLLEKMVLEQSGSGCAIVQKTSFRWGLVWQDVHIPPYVD